MPCTTSRSEAAALEREPLATARRNSRSMRLVPALAAAALSSLVFWSRGIAHLYVRHPHEDAFILFRYAQHTANGLGIVFNEGGPPTEGATDFLWMLGLAGLTRLGLDVALAALLLNALGSALLAFTAYALLTSRVPRSLTLHGLGVWLALSLPFIGGAHASYEGFSAQLYCALCVMCFWIYLDGTARRLVVLPYAGLVLALFRPDGLILGASFGALALWRCRGDRAALREVVRHAVVAAGLGAAYFLWRYRYFGQLLPLPLYVKSRGPGTLLGLSFNREWLASPAGPAPMLAIGALHVAALARWATQNGRVRRALAGGMLPGAVLLMALGFAHQSQNVDFRFQAPIFALWLAASLALIGELAAARPPLLVRGLSAALAAGMVVPAVLAGKSVSSPDYLDTLAAQIGGLLDDASIALTEAGRISFWTHGRVHDMVGLNNAHTARRPATVAHVRSVAPDFIMYHQAGTLDLKRARILAGSLSRDDVVQLDGASLGRALRRTRERPGERSDRDASPTQAAARVLARFLSSTPGFDVFAVKYYGTFRHIYGIRGASAHAAILHDALLSAHRTPYRSYAAIRALGSGGWPCRAVTQLAQVWSPVALGLPRAPDCEPGTSDQRGAPPGERHLH